MSNGMPFTPDTEQTAIAIAYKNKKLIADQLAPIRLLVNVHLNGLSTIKATNLRCQILKLAVNRAQIKLSSQLPRKKAQL